MTDYQDPSTIDIDEVIANINQSWTYRRMHWDEATAWPNVTVKALADEVRRLRRTIVRCTPFEVMQFMVDHGDSIDPEDFQDLIDARRAELNRHPKDAPGAIRDQLQESAQ